VTSTQLLKSLAFDRFTEPKRSETAVGWRKEKAGSKREKPAKKGNKKGKRTWQGREVQGKRREEGKAE